MNPDVAEAVTRLHAAGVLRAGQAERFGRVARRELVSLHVALRLVLYAGVLVTTVGVGLLLKENLERIGPLGVALGVGLLAAGCLFWVSRHAPPFTWGELPAGHLALDYVLLLGVLLLAADLAYVEVQFTPLGPAWSWHLLVVALLTGALAVRYDSPVVFSVALSSFAAWRGVSVSLGGALSVLGAEDTLRANAIGCGVVFVLLGGLMRRRQRKAHFEPAATHIGWLLVLGGTMSGIDPTTPPGLAWSWTLIVVAGGLAAYGYRARRFALFAFGLLAGYVAVTAMAFRANVFDDLAFFWFSGSAVVILVALLLAHQGMKEPE